MAKTKQTVKKTEKPSPPSISKTSPKKRRFKPGTVALREIRKEQQNINYSIPRAPFKKLLQEIAQYFGDNLRFSKDSVDMIQTYIETYIITILDNSNLIAIHNKKQSVKSKDIHLARRVMNLRN